MPTFLSRCVRGERVYNLCFLTSCRQIRKDQKSIDNWHSLGSKIKQLAEQQQQIDEFLSEVQ